MGRRMTMRSPVGDWIGRSKAVSAASAMVAALATRAAGAADAMRCAGQLARVVQQCVGVVGQSDSSARHWRLWAAKLSYGRGSVEAKISIFWQDFVKWRFSLCSGGE